MAGSAASAQGLEGIIVERYYQANAADAQYTVDQGYTYPLAEGAVTYRVYVDMAAGYKFVQMFGTATQNLVFGTTTSFYNDENYDSQAAPTTSALNTKKHTAMLDSWITAGGAAASKVGVPKDEDTDGSIANPQPQGILGNTLGGCFGLQITGATGKDGMVVSSGTTYTTPNVLGMSGSILNALVAGNSLSSITVTNGSIAALGGIVGATSTNKVLVGQFTTSGSFTFSLNVQLLSPTGTAVNYVHSNPTSGQLTNSTLIRTAGGVPTVSIASSDADNTICAGTSVTFTATPVNGGTPSYQWKLNGTNVGTNAATYTNAALANNDVVSVVMTAGGCDATGTATSNNITTVVNSSVTPSVSVASSDADNSICAGSSVTFTATPTNGGSTPSYQWKLNGTNVGTNATTYTNASLANNDVVTVVMTANNTCQSSATANGNNVTTTVATSVTPSVSVASSDADNSICSGSSVTFTATPTNGGSTPSYQWKLNGTNVGTNATTYTNASLANNDVVTVVMTANNTCQSSATANGNNVTTTVATSVTPSVSVASSDADNSICSGSSVTFTATPTNGGSTPSYQWKLNGTNVGTNATTYTNASLANNDVVTVVMTANNTCQSSATANGNNVTTAVNALSNYYTDADGDTYGAGTATQACVNPGAGYSTNNTDCNDASASVNPGATEICGNSIDEDCSGADLTCPSGGLSAITLSNISVFGVGTQSSVNVNLAAGTNTVESAGIGLDVWYQFTAAQPAVRIAIIGSSSVSDDNDIALYQAPTTTGVQLIPLVAENDVHPGNVGTLNADGGSETMYYANLTVGQVYYILARNNNNTPGTAQLRVAYIRGGAMDIAAYTNNTNTYTNNCQNFKVAFRTNATGYTVNRWVSSNISGVPDYVYAIPAGTVVQLGRIFPANFTNAAQTKYVTVDVAYSMQDAFGNNNDFTVVGNTVGTFTMSPEAALQVRATDQCPVYKTVSGSIASDRGVCGVRNYNWQFTQVLPSPGLALSIDGALSASRILPLSSVTGIANGQKYDVKVRAKHMDNASYSDFNSSANCVRTVGSAGMPVAQDAIISEAVQLSQGTFAVYPNPNTGSEVVLYANDFEGAVNVQIMDASGRIIKSDKWIVEGAGSRMINFNETLSTGMYTIRLNDGVQTQAIKMVVVR